MTTQREAFEKWWQKRHDITAPSWTKQDSFEAYQAGYKSQQAEIPRLKEQNDKLREALENLVVTKKYKDTIGKDEIYETMKIGAWKSANDALAIQQCGDGEPVAWTITSKDGITVSEAPEYCFYSKEDALKCGIEYCHPECNVVPLYLAPPDQTAKIKELEEQLKGQMMDIIERLKAQAITDEHVDKFTDAKFKNTLCKDAIAEITRLKEQNEVMREALEFCAGTSYGTDANECAKETLKELGMFNENQWK